MELIQKILFWALGLMAACIIYSLALYGIQELIEGDVSFKPKGWQYDRPTELSR